jgi:hypothetical protein
MIMRTRAFRTPPTFVAAADRRGPRPIAGDPSAPLATRAMAREILAKERRLGVGGRVLGFR